MNNNFLQNKLLENLNEIVSLWLRGDINEYSGNDSSGKQTEKTLASVGYPKRVGTINKWLNYFK